MSNLRGKRGGKTEVERGGRQVGKERGKIWKKAESELDLREEGEGRWR